MVRLFAVHITIATLASLDLVITYAHGVASTAYRSANNLPELWFILNLQ